ncbi:MAG: hypothetical protein LQ349_003770 [Xanthoria aureola]|nr:MAG: hypothetical protein LQ349_003770 [Xanthoria aureola]
MIYHELIPDNSVAIYPHENSEHRFKHPWTLISVSKQFRQEIWHEISSRMTARVRTRKVPRDTPGDRAEYEADAMQRDVYLGPLLKRLVVNENVDIKWKPNSTTFDAPHWRGIQPKDSPRSEPYKLMKVSWPNIDEVYYNSHRKTFAEHIGDWQILWRNQGAQMPPSMYAVRITLAAIDKSFGKTKLGTTMPGLRKIDIVRLVAAHRGFAFIEIEWDDEMADNMAKPKNGRATSEEWSLTQLQSLWME